MMPIACNHKHLSATTHKCRYTVHVIRHIGAMLPSPDCNITVLGISHRQIPVVSFLVDQGTIGEWALEGLPSAMALITGKFTKGQNSRKSEDSRVAEAMSCPFRTPLWSRGPPATP